MIARIRKTITNKLEIWLPPRYDKLVALDRLFHSNSFPDIIIFGDSVAERVARQDVDTRNLGKMVTDLFQKADRSCFPISYSAYHMLVYHGFILAMQKKACFPRLIILSINMRSFSPQWDLRPYWQFSEEIAILNEYCKMNGKKIGRLRKKRQEDIQAVENAAYRNMTVNYPLSGLNQIGKFVDVIESNPQTEDEILRRKREIFVFHYAHPLVPNHRKVVALDQILDVLCQNEIKLLVYVTPINFKAGERLVGTGFKSQVDKNVQVVGNLITAHEWPGLKFADWSCLFDSSYFFSEDLATEHINQSGRQELARRIAYEASSLLDMKT